MNNISDEELAALPPGPWVRRTRAATPEEAARLGCRYIEWIEDKPVAPNNIRSGDIVYWTDKAGERWSVGQWADGQWFKQRWV